MGDPVLLGYHDAAGAEVSCIVLRKRHPDEKVGVLARIGDHVGVVEYTEIDAASREARDERGELRFGAGNAAIHAFLVEFVRRVAAAAEELLPFHASAKKIPWADADGATRTPDEPNGFKLERFVFDALPAAETVCVVETSREHYSPVKNATGSDSPATARRDLSARYRHWIEDAGLPAPPPGDFVEIDEARIGGADDLRALGIARLEEAADCILTRPGDPT